MKPSMAIITVVYNSAGTILDTMRSVEAQQGIQTEHIIVDGGSVDGTLELMHNSNSHSTLISEPDLGVYDAMNKGVRIAESDIVGFLNSDDVYFDPQVLNYVQSAFENDPALEIVYGDLVYVRKNDLNKVVRHWQSRPYDDRFFEEGNVPPHPAFFVKRRTLIESGGFDLAFSFAADYELMFRLLKIESRRSHYLAQVLVRMRLGGKTNQTLGNILAGNKEILRVWSKHRVKISLRFWLRRYLLKVKQYLRALTEHY